MITTFFFDLGGVLFTNGTKHFIRVISEKHSLPSAFVKSIIDGELGTLYRENKIDKEEFWQRAIAALGILATADDLNNVWENGYELINGTKEIVLALRGKYKVYYLSDNVKNRVNFLDRKYGFLQWFDGGVFSFDANMRKPDPKIYYYALNKASTTPAESIFIDDKEEALKPAKEIGFTTILFENPEKLHSDLSSAHLL